MGSESYKSSILLHLRPVNLEQEEGCICKANLMGAFHCQWELLPPGWTYHSQSLSQQTERNNGLQRCPGPHLCNEVGNKPLMTQINCSETPCQHDDTPHFWCRRQIRWGKKSSPGHTKHTHRPPTGVQHPLWSYKSVGAVFSGLEAVSGRIGQSLKQEKATRGNLHPRLCGASDLENTCKFLSNQNRQASVSTRVGRHKGKSAQPQPVERPDAQGLWVVSTTQSRGHKTALWPVGTESYTCTWPSCPRPKNSISYSRDLLSRGHCCSQ